MTEDIAGQDPASRRAKYEEADTIRPESACRIVVVICGAWNNGHDISGAEALLLGYSLGICRPANLPYILRCAFRQPEWTPQPVPLEQEVAERMTGIIGDVIRRFVFRNDKSSIRSAKQIGG